MRSSSLFTLLLAVLFGGCAAIEQNEAAQQEKWLLQAGFQVMKADTPAKRASLSKMTPYKIEGTVRGDTVIYRYVNPVQGRVFHGGPREFAAYEKIAVSVKARRSANLSQITPGGSRVTGPLMW